jgi:hypothetical protein
LQHVLLGAKLRGPGGARDWRGQSPRGVGSFASLLPASGSDALSLASQQAAAGVGGRLAARKKKTMLDAELAAAAVLPRARIGQRAFAGLWSDKLVEDGLGDSQTHDLASAPASNEHGVSAAFAEILLRSAQEPKFEPSSQPWAAAGGKEGVAAAAARAAEDSSGRSSGKAPLPQSALGTVNAANLGQGFLALGAATMDKRMAEVCATHETLHQNTCMAKMCIGRCLYPFELARLLL